MFSYLFYRELQQRLEEAEKQAQEWSLMSPSTVIDHHIIHSIHVYTCIHCIIESIEV